MFWLWQTMYRMGQWWRVLGKPFVDDKKLPFFLWPVSKCVFWFTSKSLCNWFLAYIFAGAWRHITFFGLIVSNLMFCITVWRDSAEKLYMRRSKETVFWTSSVHSSSFCCLHVSQNAHAVSFSANSAIVPVFHAYQHNVKSKYPGYCRQRNSVLLDSEFVLFNYFHIVHSSYIFISKSVADGKCCQQQATFRPSDSFILGLACNSQ